MSRLRYMHLVHKKQYNSSNHFSHSLILTLRYSFEHTHPVPPPTVHPRTPKRAKAKETLASLDTSKKSLRQKKQRIESILAGVVRERGRARGMAVRRAARRKQKSAGLRAKEAQEGGAERRRRSRGGEKVEDASGPTWYLRRHFLADCQ